MSVRASLSGVNFTHMWFAFALKMQCFHAYFHVVQVWNLAFKVLKQTGIPTAAATFRDLGIWEIIKYKAGNKWVFSCSSLLPIALGWLKNVTNKQIITIALLKSKMKSVDDIETVEAAINSPDLSASEGSEIASMSIDSPSFTLSMKFSFMTIKIIKRS